MNQTEEVTRAAVNDLTDSLNSNLMSKKLRTINRCKTGKSLAHRIKLENSKNTICKHNRSVSKSPLRSRSQRSLAFDKNLTVKKKSVSPPGGVSRAKLRKTLSSKIDLRYEKIHKVTASEVCVPVLREKSENYKKSGDELGKKSYLKQKNKKIKGSSCRGVKVTGKIKKVRIGKRLTTEDERSSSTENKDFRGKTKLNLAKKVESKALDIDSFLMRMKKVLGKAKKSPEPKQRKFIKSKKASMKTFDLTNFDDITATYDVFRTTEKLEKPQKKKLGKKVKKTKNTEDQPPRPHSSMSRTKRKIISKPRTKKDFQTEENLSCNINSIKKRVDSNFNTIVEATVKKIQRWFRKILKKKKKVEKVKKGECPDFDVSDIVQPCNRMMETNIGKRKYPNSIDFWNPEKVEQSQDLVEMCIVPRSGYRNRNYNKSEAADFYKINNFNPSRDQASNNITLLSTSSLPHNPSASSILHSSFQHKRPKELDIENINTPLVSVTNRFSDKFVKEEILLENKSTTDLPEENKHSFQSDSLEREPSFKKPKKLPYFLVKSEKIKEKSRKIVNLPLQPVNITEKSEETFVMDSRNTQNSEKSQVLSRNSVVGEKHSFAHPELKTEKLKNLNLDVVPVSSPNQEITEEMPQIPFKFQATPTKSQMLDMQAEIYLKSIGCGDSDKDSLESDIDISSTVIRELENSLNRLNSNNSSFESGVNTSYKIPISSPNLSFNVNDILSEIVETELSYFSRMINFKSNEKQVDPSLIYVEKVVQSLFKELKKNEADFLDIINTPGFTDPLAKLQLLQGSNVGELKKSFDLEIMIPQEICDIIQQILANEQFRGRKIYIQMVFDCVNEVFNYIRPFGIWGVPDPWINHSRLLFGEGELSRVYDKAVKYIEEWAKIKGGVYLDRVSARDVEKLQLEREERMSSFLCFDVNFEEELWVDYKDEETQTKCDVADIILDDLFLETVYCIRNLSF